MKDLIEVEEEVSPDPSEEEAITKEKEVVSAVIEEASAVIEEVSVVAKEEASVVKEAASVVKAEEATITENLTMNEIVRLYLASLLKLQGE